MCKKDLSKIYQDIETDDINRLNLLKIPHPLPDDASPQNPWEYYQACFERLFSTQKSDS